MVPVVVPVVVGAGLCDGGRRCQVVANLNGCAGPQTGMRRTRFVLFSRTIDEPQARHVLLGGRQQPRRPPHVQRLDPVRVEVVAGK